MATHAAPGAHRAMTTHDNHLRRRLLYSVVRLVLLGTCVAMSWGLPVNAVLWVLLTVELLGLVSVLTVVFHT